MSEIKLSMQGKAGLKNQRLSGGSVLTVWKGAAIVFTFSFLLYANSISNQYNLDDELVTSVDAKRQHPLTSKGVAAIPEIFTKPYYSDGMGYAYDYRPIVLISFAIEHSLFGDNPHVSHFFNVLLYSLLCVLLLIALHHLLSEYHALVPFLITLLFAAFPVHTEVVASIKNRDEILSLLGGLGALYFFISYADNRKKILLLCAGFSFAFGLLSKQTVLSLIIIIPILLIIFKKLPPRQILVVFFVLVAIAFPFIQILFLTDRLVFVGAIFVFIMLVEQIKNGTVLIRIKEKANMLSSWMGMLKDRFLKRTRLMQASDLPALPGEQPRVTFQLSYPVIIICFISICIISLPLLIFKSFFAVIPLLAFLPLCFFSPSGLKKYFIWLCLLVAGIVSYWSKEFLVYDMAVLFFLYHFLVDSKARRIPNAAIITILCIWGFIIFGYENSVTFVFILIVIGFAYLPGFKWIKLLPVAVIVISIAQFLVQGPARLFGEYALFNNLEILHLLLFLMVLFMPQRSKLIISCIYSATIILLIPQLVASYNNVNISIGAVETPKLTLNIGPPSFRPMDYAETVIDAGKTPFREKLGTGMMTIGKYLKLTLIPYPMSFYYGYKVIEKTDIALPVPVIIGVLFTALWVMALVFLKKDWIISAGLFIYVVSIFPASNILSPIPGMVADRLLFIPSLGFCVLLTWLLMKVFAVSTQKAEKVPSLKYLPAAFKFACAAVLIAYSGMTLARNRQWHDTLTLMRHDITHLEESAQAHNLLATSLARKAVDGTSDSEARLLLLEAETHLEKAISIYSDFFNAVYDLGRVRMMLGKLDEAELDFNKAIELDSTFPESFHNLALIRVNRKDFSGAIPYYEKYISIKPDNMAALMDLSFCYAQTHDLQNAMVYMKKAMNLFPRKPEPLINLSRIFADMGQLDSAIFYIRKAEIISPGHPDVRMLKEAFNRQDANSN